LLLLLLILTLVSEDHQQLIVQPFHPPHLTSETSKGLLLLKTIGRR
jgi:hypothetical protein